jgi:prepilin-type N-terminal cleavage/methylation domain-containing protein
MLHYFRKKFGLPARTIVQAGFTIPELIISITIASIILTIVVSNQATYTDGANVTNLADEIGLTISQAQVYGIAVKEFTPGSSDFSASYGLAFSLLGSGSNGAYISFADRNANKIYDGDWSCPLGGASECLGRVNISRGNFIESLCVVRISEADLCDVGRIDISFVRPNIEAKLIFFNSGGLAFVPANMKGAKIKVQSPGGLIKSVTVFETGQVSVQ